MSVFLAVPMSFNFPSKHTDLFGLSHGLLLLLMGSLILQNSSSLTTGSLDWAEMGRSGVRRPVCHQAVRLLVC